MLNIGEFARLGQVSPRMLRHYDAIGLLRPERVDPKTGYRSYGVAQLARLQRVLALRDLGFGLEQIAPLLERPPSSSLAPGCRNHAHKLRHLRRRRWPANLRRPALMIAAADGGGLENGWRPPAAPGSSKLDDWFETAKEHALAIERHGLGIHHVLQARIGHHQLVHAVALPA
jgi:DNA-binding transcriptional MerR regulator